MELSEKKRVQHRMPGSTGAAPHRKFAATTREALEWWGDYCDTLEGLKAKHRAVKGGR